MTSDLRLALVGGAVELSPSPAMHRAAMAATGRRGDYEVVSVDDADLDGCLAALRDRDVIGVNVTIPHKQAVLRTVTRLASGAAAAGAVNTLCADGAGWVGHNTDATGLARMLAPYPLDGATAVILGAGGMARAAVVGLRSRCAQLIVVNRHAGRAAAMVESLRDSGKGPLGPVARLTTVAATDLDALVRALGAASILINATSVGMHDPLASPLPSPVGLGSVRLVCDAVHTPRWTALLRRAEASGATVLDGLGLLAAQAADSFALWTGERVPDAVFRGAVPVPSSA
ncbi:MAG: shikimate dehydrogenase [Candidatus Dormibacteria bacterium]